MSYEKKYLPINALIKTEWDNQEDRISAQFDSMSKLGEIKDYIIDSGSNNNGDWEKWFSGKLVMSGMGTVSGDGYTKESAGGFGGWYSPVTKIPLPYTLITKDNTVVNANLDGQAYRSPWISSLHVSDTKNIEVRVSQLTSSGMALNVYWTVIGRWK